MHKQKHMRTFIADQDVTCLASKQSREHMAMLRLAKKLKIQNNGNVDGHCLYMSLLFAKTAKRQGISVSLLRWTVLRDDQFADHWAVKFSDDVALDLTSIQFDPKGTILQKINAYPGNFVHPMTYPATIFADAQLPRGDLLRFPISTMWVLYKKIFKQDIRSAYKAKTLHRMPRIGLQFIKQGLSLLMRCLDDWAFERLQKNRDSIR
jgi:hypothetical protein